MAHAQAELKDEESVVDNVDGEHKDEQEVDDRVLLAVEQDTAGHEEVG